MEIRRPRRRNHIIAEHERSSRDSLAKDQVEQQPLSIEVPLNEYGHMLVIANMKRTVRFMGPRGHIEVTMDAKGRLTITGTEVFAVFPRHANCVEIELEQP